MKLFTGIGAFLHGARHFFDAPAGFTETDREFYKLYDDLFDGALALGLQPGPKESPYVVMIDLDVFLFLYFEKDKKRTTTYVEYKDLTNNNLWKGYRDNKGSGGCWGMTTKEKLLDIIQCLKEVKRKMDGLPAETEQIEVMHLVKRFLDHYGIGSLTIYDGQYVYESAFCEFEGIKVDVMVQVEARFNPPSNHYLDIRVFKDSDPRHRLARFNWKFSSEGNVRGILDSYGFVVEEITKLNIEQLKEVFDLKQLREEGETVADHVEAKFTPTGELKAAIKRIQSTAISPQLIREDSNYGDVIHAKYKDTFYKVGTGGHRNGAQTPDVFIVMGYDVIGRCFINSDGVAQLQDVREAFHNPIQDFAAIINAAVDQNEIKAGTPVGVLEDELTAAIKAFHSASFGKGVIGWYNDHPFVYTTYQHQVYRIRYGDIFPCSEGPGIIVNHKDGLQVGVCYLLTNGKAHHEPKEVGVTTEVLIGILKEAVKTNASTIPDTGVKLSEVKPKESETTADEPPFIDMDFIDLSDVWVEWYSITHKTTTVEAVRVGMRKLKRFHEQLTARLASVNEDA